MEKWHDNKKNTAAKPAIPVGSKNIENTVFSTCAAFFNLMLLMYIYRHIKIHQTKDTPGQHATAI